MLSVGLVNAIHVITYLLYCYARRASQCRHIKCISGAKFRSTIDRDTQFAHIIRVRAGTVVQQKKNGEKLQNNKF